jgi:hypothetical protein
MATLRLFPKSTAFPFLEGWSAAIVPFFTTLSRLVDVEFEDDRKGMN